ncbi:hypothetical protein [Aetokthonos hydrillicola]|jgi:hypothetical protein
MQDPLKARCLRANARLRAIPILYAARPRNCAAVIDIQISWA